MAKRKKITASELLTFYMDYVLEHGEKPKSVYTFAKVNSFEEATFYKFYGSFEALEKDVFNTFFENTINTLNKSKEYKTYESRNKLLSFYYTFFENLTANRSYVTYALKKSKGNLKSLTTLSTLRKSFTHYIQELDIETIDVKQEKLEKIQQRTIKESAWIQLLITIKFWIDDTSASFEKTDIFIEKAVNTSFDLMNIKPLKSVVDFGKFLFKEKMQMN